MQQLYYQISIMQQQLAECMDRLAKIEQQLQERNQTSSSPSTIHIEKIEYKFDQLKVETLEGTLSIGMSPSELTKHDVEIPGLYRQEQLQEQTKQFILEEIPAVFADCSTIYDPSGKTITQDHLADQLLQQVPQRIEHLQANHQGPAPLSNDQLLALVQRDVSHALHTLRAQQPENHT